VRIRRFERIQELAHRCSRLSHENHGDRPAGSPDFEGHEISVAASSRLVVGRNLTISPFTREHDFTDQLQVLVIRSAELERSGSQMYGQYRRGSVRAIHRDETSSDELCRAGVCSARLIPSFGGFAFCGLFFEGVERRLLLLVFGRRRYTGIAGSGAVFSFRAHLSKEIASGSRNLRTVAGLEAFQ